MSYTGVVGNFTSHCHSDSMFYCPLVSGLLLSMSVAPILCDVLLEDFSGGPRVLAAKRILHQRPKNRAMPDISGYLS